VRNFNKLLTTTKLLVF